MSKNKKKIYQRFERESPYAGWDENKLHRLGEATKRTFKDRMERISKPIFGV